MPTSPVSFHLLKDRPILSRSRMADSASRIANGLDDYIRRTEEAVQMRDGKELATSGRKSLEHMKDQGERRLEALILARWKSASSEFLPEVCPRLISNQIPMMDKRKAEKWGKIDILGCSAGGDPVVIELKQGKAGDSPLRAIIEGVAYAVALRKNWTYFQSKIERPSDLQWSPMHQICPVYTVVLAPEEFWQKLSRSKVSKGALPALADLEKRLSKAGYPVRFSSVRVGKEITNPKYWSVSDGFESPR